MIYTPEVEVRQSDPFTRPTGIQELARLSRKSAGRFRCFQFFSSQSAKRKVPAFVAQTGRKNGEEMRAAEKAFKDFLVTLWRWRDFQNDFAARMDWTFKPYEDANHPPVPVLNHAETITVRSGNHFLLDGELELTHWSDLPGNSGQD
jgi:hypothetical protein